MGQIVGFPEGYAGRLAKIRIPSIMYHRTLKSDTGQLVSISVFFRGVICDRSFSIRDDYKSETNGLRNYTER